MSQGGEIHPTTARWHSSRSSKAFSASLPRSRPTDDHSTSLSVPSSSFHPERQLGKIDIRQGLVIIMRKFLENALKIMPTEKSGRRIVAGVGMGRVCEVPVDNGQYCWSRDASVDGVAKLGLSGFGIRREHMTFINSLPRILGQDENPAGIYRTRH